MNHTFQIEEGDRQAIILALAKLSLTRPGWHPACLSRIAEQLGGLAMYNQFRSYGSELTPEFKGAISTAITMVERLAHALDDGEEGEGSRCHRAAANIGAHLKGALMILHEGPARENSSALPRPVSALAFLNGNLAVFDNEGNQIAELQRGWPAMWAEHAERLGFDAEGVVFEVQGGEKWRTFRRADRSIGWEVVE